MAPVNEEMDVDDYEEEEEEEVTQARGRRKRSSTAASAAGSRASKRRQSDTSNKENDAEEEEEDEEDAEEDEQPSKGKGKGGKGKGKVSAPLGGGGGGSCVARRPRHSSFEQEVEAEDDLYESSDGDDDEGFVEVDAQIAAAQRERRMINAPGRQAETGIIVKIYCENFMCHRKLTVALCPNVNFVHGQNGSGKSAILAALQICLGARAKDTHRANGLADLIRQGHDGHAIVRVTLMNRGTDAFEHDKYGDFITVERKINRNGQGDYRMLKGEPSDGAHLEIVSKKKEDLERMLDLFNIQIENPCALLDQENAKKFIQGGEKEKYKFFERATDIDRVHHYLSDALEKNEATKQRLEASSEQLKVLKKDFKELEKKVEEMQGVAQVEQEIKDKKVQVEWQKLIDKQEETQTIVLQILEVEGKLEQQRAKVAKAEEDKNGRFANVKEDEEEIATLQEQIADAKSKMKDIQREIAARKKPIVTLEAQGKTKAEDIKNYLRKKKDAQNEMKAERERLAAQAEAEVGTKVARMKEIDVELENLEGERERKIDRLEQIRGQDGERGAVKVRMQEAQNNLARAQRTCGDIQRQLKGLEGSAGNNPVAVFGKQMVNIVHDIERSSKRFKEQPIGPLGVHIKIKKGSEEWAGAVENALGSTFTNFVVTSHQDRKVLQDIISRHGAGNFVSVYTATKSRRYQVARPPGNFHPLAECVAVENDLIWNTLIDWAKMDASAVVKRRQDADSLVQGTPKRFPGRVKTVYDMEDGMSELRLGALNYRAIGHGRGRVLGKDTTAMRTSLQRDLVGAQGVLKQAQQEAANVERQLKALDAEELSLKRALQGMTVKMNQLEEEKRDLSEEIADAATAKEARVDFAEIERTIESYDDQIKELQEAHAAIKAKRAELEKELGPLKGQEANERNRNERLTAELDKAKAKIDGKLDEIDGVDHAIRKAQKGLRKIEDALCNLRQQREKTMAVERALLQQVTDYTKKVLPGWDKEEQIKPTGTIKELQATIRRLEEKLRRRREQTGVHETMDSVMTKYNNAKLAYLKKKQLLTDITARVERFYKSHEKRLVRLRVLRRFIMRRSTMSFDGVLQHKGQSGGLEFDCKERALKLTVQKDNRDESTQSQNVRELSGGERSYTTLALLIALGEAIECPFRVMDEFDIFMDAVSRKTALDLLCQYAMREDMKHRQFIFITPQDLTYVQSRVSNTFRIHKLLPPVRNHGTLQQQTIN